MKNKTMITDSPSHCANIMLWVSAAIDKFKARMALLWSSGRKRGNAIGADKDDLSSVMRSTTRKINWILLCLGIWIVLVPLTSRLVIRFFFPKNPRVENSRSFDSEKLYLENRVRQIEQRIEVLEQQQQNPK
ncbi:MAG: hypothetical protein ACKO96_31905 [Flammeovirgaceae bacterium]